MSDELKYIIFESKMGWVGILASWKGLLSIALPQPSAEETGLQLGEQVNQAIWSPELFADLVLRLQAYFSGRQVSFPDELDLSAATPFQREVWAATRLIPYGETRSYRWVAEQTKRPKAMRAVGQALGKNPLPIVVPCHRVITSGGKLGGFRGGLTMKEHLLRQESSH